MRPKEADHRGGSPHSEESSAPSTSVDNKKGRNEVATRDFFAPFRTTNMATDDPVTEPAVPDEAVPAK